MAGQTITAVIAADARPFKKGMTDAAKSTAILTTSLKNMSKIGVASFAALTAATIVFIGKSIQAADEANQISKGLQTAVKNSKAFGTSAANIAKVTDALDAASAKLGELTGIDDEVISGLKRNWLAVPRIAATGVAGINKLALVAANVAAGTGKDLEAVANAFTKAYGDPKNALGKLQKLGVVLSEQEKARYEQLIKNGKETEALGFLTDTLNSKFKGAAEAAASPFQRIQVAFGNLQESLGQAFLPILEKLVPSLQKMFDALANDSAFNTALANLADSLEKNLPDFIKFVPTLIDGVTNLLNAVKDFLPVAKAIIDFGNTTFVPLGYNLNDPQGAANAAAANARAAAGQGAISTTNITINASSIDTSASTGRAIANALSNYYRHGGRTLK